MPPANPKLLALHLQRMLFFAFCLLFFIDHATRLLFYMYMYHSDSGQPESAAVVKNRHSARMAQQRNGFFAKIQHIEEHFEDFKRWFEDAGAARFPKTALTDYAEVFS